MGSMPKKDPAAEEKLAEEQESLGLNPAFKPAPSNPNFDPPFMNDVRLVDRGFLNGIMHFVNKNTDNLSRSIFDRIVSPLKFAGCVNNYSELRQRYRHLMELEAAESSPWRVRFVNYYTTSTGCKPRKSKTKLEKKAEKSAKKEKKAATKIKADMDKRATEVHSQEHSKMPSFEETEVNTSMSDMAIERKPLETAISHSSLATEKASGNKDTPLADDTSIASSISTTVQSEEPLSGSISLSTESGSIITPEPSAPSEQQLRKFILLPSHHWKYNDNSHWEPILMEDMDEVMAHQSMFIPQGANYDYLVGNSVGLIEQWIENDLSRRFLQESLD
ncbi:hypothetical protein PENCOP_c005G08915 [Penicillium coprophilum]|uniref:Uncharacterized protein n=1 Tax=Penicillium coprophilum TaxID=36646 RepID=A0A1V6US47_9EURO|nr:hypothetical protein PENCOP_c005G08915 [Penicillium coprophilum]